MIVKGDFGEGGGWLFGWWPAVLRALTLGPHLNLPLGRGRGMARGRGGMSIVADGYGRRTGGDLAWWFSCWVGVCRRFPASLVLQTYRGWGFHPSVKFETLKSAMIYITPLFLPVGDSGERDDTSFSK